MLLRTSNSLAFVMHTLQTQSLPPLRLSEVLPPMPVLSSAVLGALAALAARLTLAPLQHAAPLIQLAAVAACAVPMAGTLLLRERDFLVHLLDVFRATRRQRRGDALPSVKAAEAGPNARQHHSKAD
jgi:hypothetical protein